MLVTSHVGPCSAAHTPSCHASDQRDRVTRELRQQALQEVLVLRQVSRPDVAPPTRPRRSATATPWDRTAAFEEQRAASQHTEE